MGLRVWGDDGILMHSNDAVSIHAHARGATIFRQSIAVSTPNSWAFRANLASAVNNTAS